MHRLRSPPDTGPNRLSFELFRGQDCRDDYSMTHTRSLRDLLVWFCRDPESTPPFVHAAYRNRDRVFGADEIVAELAFADVTQHRSFVQARPGSDLGGLEQLLHRD